MAEFWLCLFGGYLGLHKFYKRQWGLGILYLLTCGVFFIGWIYDTVKIGIKAAKGELVKPEDVKKKKQAKLEKKLAKQQAREEKVRQRELAMQQRQERIKQLEQQGVAYCPMCLSTSVQYIERRKQLSVTRGVVGTVLFNPIIGTIGALTSKKHYGYVKCLKCGHMWRIS